MPKDNGPCPQKTAIEYPERPRKQYKFAAVDFIPKKKNAMDSMAEIEKEKNKPLVCYGPRGKTRDHMIEELQEINRFGDKKALDMAVAREKKWKKEI